MSRAHQTGAGAMAILALASGSAMAIPHVTFVPPGPGLQVPFETTRYASEYGVNWQVAGWNFFKGPGGEGEGRPVSASAILRYFTSNQNPPDAFDTNNRVGMPTTSDWVLDVSFRNTGGDFNDDLFYTKAKESLPGETRLLAVVDDGSNNWQITLHNVPLVTGLSFTSPIEAPVYHTMTAHYKAATNKLDLWVDGAQSVADYDVGTLDMGIDSFQATTSSTFPFEGRTVGIGYALIGQLATDVDAAWNVNDEGNWSTGSNWTGGVAPDGPYHVARFGSAITAAHTVTVDAPKTVGTISFDNANSYTIAGSSAITMNVLGGQVGIDVLSGSHTISAPVILSQNLTVNSAASAGVALTGDLTATGKTINKTGEGTVQFKSVRGFGLNVGSGTVRIGQKATANDASGTSIVNGFAIGTGAVLDLTNNSLILDYTGTPGQLEDTIRQHLHDGRLITTASSPAGAALGFADNASLGLSSFGGQTVDSSSLLVKFTYQGDTNLDGQVDVIDLGNLATAWQTNGMWTKGDSNYDGFVDVIDLGLLATNWQAGVGAPLGPQSLGQALAAFGLPSVSVPEPAELAVFGLGLMMGVRGRRRHRSGSN